MSAILKFLLGTAEENIIPNRIHSHLVENLLYDILVDHADTGLGMHPKEHAISWEEHIEG